MEDTMQQEAAELLNQPFAHELPLADAPLPTQQVSFLH